MFAFIAAALRALKNALYWTAYGAFQIVTWPLRMLSTQGRSAVPSIEKGEDKSHTMAEDTRKFAAEVLAASQPGQPTAGLKALLDARKTVDWARIVVASKGATVPQMPAISVKASLWLCGLKQNQLLLLGKCSASTLAAHMSGRAHIDGLPKVSEQASSNPSSQLYRPFAADVSDDGERLSAGPGSRRPSPRSRRSRSSADQSFEPASALSP
jgi:hypothetical protein